MSEHDYHRLPPEPHEGDDHASGGSAFNRHARTRPPASSSSSSSSSTSSMTVVHDASSLPLSSASSPVIDTRPPISLLDLSSQSSSQRAALRSSSSRISSAESRSPVSPAPDVLRQDAAAADHPRLSPSAPSPLLSASSSPPCRPVPSYLSRPLPHPQSARADESSRSSPPPPRSRITVGNLRAQLGREWSLRDLGNHWSERRREQRHASQPSEEEANDAEDGEEERDGSHKISPFLSRLLALRTSYMADVDSATVNADFASSSLSSTLAASRASPQPSSSELLTRSLRFTDPSIERSYNADYFTRYFRVLRTIVLICVTIWCLFVVNDIYQHFAMHKRKNFDLTVGLRFLVAGLVGFSTLASYHRRVKQHIGTGVLRWSILLFILMFGTCQVVFGVLEKYTPDPTYCDFIILIASMSASFFRLPFFMSTLCNLLLCVIFVALSMPTQSWQCPDDYLPPACRGELDFVIATIWISIAWLLFTLNAYIIEYSMRTTFLAAHQLSLEEEKTQHILATMLPTKVITELRVASAFVYERHPSVSVLFSHIHDFDAHTAALKPKAVVELLNSLFQRFDHLTDIFGVYKVETIGDVYLVSGGVPDHLEGHACIVSLLSLAMMEEMKLLSRSLGKEELQLRVGIHSGDVIAGVVGMKYPRYRLMGDTVNVASRMSTTCQANQIQLSQATFTQLRPEFVCRFNGKRMIKGRGEMETYLLHYVLGVDGSGLPISIEEAIGSKTAEEVADELGLPPPVMQQPPHVRTASQPALFSVRGVASKDREKERRLSLTPVSIPSSSASAIATPSSSRQHSAPGSRRASFEPSGVPEYHAHPLPGRLYSNVSLPPSIVALTGDDTEAIRAAIEAGRTVHQVRERGQQGKGEEKKEVSTLVDGHSARITARRTSGPMVIVREERRDDQEDAEQTQADHTAAAGGGGCGEELEMQAMDDAQQYQTSPSTAASGGPGSPSPVCPPAGAPVTPPSTVLLPPSRPLSPSSSQGELSPADGAAPSTIYTLSAEHVRSTFLTHSTHPAYLARFRAAHHHTRHLIPIRAQLHVLFSHPLEGVVIMGRRAVAVFRLAFTGDAELERRFQAHWVKRSLKICRLGFTCLLLGLLILGVLEPVTRGDLWKSTLKLRVPAMLIGGCVVLLSYCYPRWFCQWQQPVVAVSWAAMTMLQIMITVLLEENTRVYGVSGTLILVTSTSFFVGLQFRWVSFTTLSILVFYTIAGISSPHGSWLNAFFLLAAVILSMMSAHSSEYFTRLDYIRELTLHEEERKTREILDNMLPKQIMTEIVGTIGTGAIIATECQHASVLFCDIVSFTALAAVIRPEDVVAILNVMFSTFDALTTKHGVYKVETIGDAYLACSGVVQQRARHHESLVQCALDFQAASHYFHTADNQPLQVRIGMHTGTVVAGVVGRKMPRYHLFGETVTIAEEMEKSGVIGAVVISAALYAQVSEHFACRRLKDVPFQSAKQSLSRYEVLFDRGARELDAGLSDLEGELRSLPPVVMEILQKVSEANVRKQAEREKRALGAAGVEAKNRDRYTPQRVLSLDSLDRGQAAAGGGQNPARLGDSLRVDAPRRRANSDTTSTSPMTGRGDSLLTPLLGAGAEGSSPLIAVTPPSPSYRVGVSSPTQARLLALASQPSDRRTELVV